MVYSRFPDRATHSLAERHRELFYYHAHPAIVYIYRMIRDEGMVLDDWEERFCDVTLDVLSHRYQPGDEEMIDYIGYLLNKFYGFEHHASASSIMHQALDHQQVVRLLLYELTKLKASATRDQYQ